MKSIFRSRTFWIAVAQGVLGVLTAMFTEMPELQSVGYIVLVKSFLDVLVRMDTKEAVTIK